MADRRTSIPAAEYQSVMRQEEPAPVRLSFRKRGPDLARSSSGAANTMEMTALPCAPPLYIRQPETGENSRPLICKLELLLQETLQREA